MSEIGREIQTMRKKESKQTERESKRETRNSRKETEREIGGRDIERKKKKDTGRV